MDFNSALSRYRAIIDSYDALEFDDLHKTAELMKDMAVVLSYITMERNNYKKAWNSVIFESGKTMSNAAAKANADHQVPELYESRRIHEAGKHILDTMRSQVSLLKQEQ